MQNRNNKDQARKILKGFKSENYIFGLGVLDQLGKLINNNIRNVSVVADGIGTNWAEPLLTKLQEELIRNKIQLAGSLIKGARPNAPREDVDYIKTQIKLQNPDMVISVGGGSTIDATKAALSLYCLSDKYPNIDSYFGVGEITAMLQKEQRTLLPHLAINIAASSAAHLTKYSNITDINSNQKMLIVDTSIVPSKALFDYSYTLSQPASLTVDGALDGISHSLEVLMGVPDDQLDKVLPTCLTGIDLIISNLRKVVENPGDMEAREGIGLGTDLGGHAIMIGGTNGAHLNSFSMTDILSHGRACALMNPYYVVFFSTRIDERLKKVAQIFANAGYIDQAVDSLKGRDVGIALAEGMLKLFKEIGFPVTLSEVPGFTENHVVRCLEAAKNPKLESKLKNMPVPLSAKDVDEYMGSVLSAAVNGDMRLIKNMI
jgi:alcohol dehydrogenase